MFIGYVIRTAGCFCNYVDQLTYIKLLDFYLTLAMSSDNLQLSKSFIQIAEESWRAGGSAGNHLRGGLPELHRDLPRGVPRHIRTLGHTNRGLLSR